MPLYHVGTLVLYRASTAVVTALNGDKIAIRTESGDTKNVREKDLEYIHSGPVTKLPPTLLPDPNLTEIRELMDGESLSFSDFAELLYGSFTSDAAWSARKLLEAGIYFRRTDGGLIELRPAEEIAATLAAQQEKQAAKERHAALLDRIRTGALLPDDRKAMCEIELVAKGINPSSRLMHELGIEATPEKAHLLLLKLGVWDYTVNPHPERAGIDRSAPAFALPETEIRPVPRTDLTELTAYAIDDEGSRDPDDAVAWDADRELLWVHVADPSSVIEFDGEADREARERGENLYLPEQVVPMLPEIATERFGLGLAGTSPAISFGIRFTDTGEAELSEICLSTVHVERKTYDTAHDWVSSAELQPLRDRLERFRAFRRENGALFIQLPEVKIRYTAPDIAITPQPITPEREFVANAMLAAGSAVAKWAVSRDLPMPFVTQEAPDAALERGDALPAMFALRKGCQAGITGTTPGLHAGLGLDPYVRVTSPLRRYTDLLAHHQIHRVLSGSEPLSGAELDDALSASEPGTTLRRRVERFSNEYWTLVYLTRMPADWTTEAVFVYRQDDRVTFLLPSLAYEYKNRFGGAMTPGDTFGVKLLGVEPATFTLRLRLL